MGEEPVFLFKTLICNLRDSLSKLNSNIETLSIETENRNSKNVVISVVYKSSNAHF